MNKPTQEEAKLIELAGHGARMFADKFPLPVGLERSQLWAMSYDNLQADLEGKNGLLPQVDSFIYCTFAKRRALRVQKNADYGSSWRQKGLKGIVTRLGDKMARIDSLAWFNQKPQVEAESTTDTLEDMANYADFGLFCLFENNIDGSNLR